MPFRLTNLGLLTKQRPVLVLDIIPLLVATNTCRFFPLTTVLMEEWFLFLAALPRP
jgi:hypothetical protein